LVDFQDSLGRVGGRIQVGDQGEDAISQRFLFEGLAVQVAGKREVRFPAYLALLPGFGPAALGKVLLALAVDLDLAANPVLGLMDLEDLLQGLLNGWPASEVVGVQARLQLTEGVKGL